MKPDVLRIVLQVSLLVGLALILFLRPAQRQLEAAQIEQAYAHGAPAVEGPLSVYHLGHSLVGRDMPLMLKQLAGEGHVYASQLGQGTSLAEHFEPARDIRGFETENDHPAFRAAQSALASGDYDVFVLTEMVEIRDAIGYHESATYLRKWEETARAANPDIRIYLYETWHQLDDPEGWLDRIDDDLTRHWEDEVLLANRDDSFVEMPTYVIPGGQVMAAFVRKVEAAGGIGNVRSREDLFLRKEDGTLDTIHISEIGAYLIALAHYAVIYQRSPVGLPYQLVCAHGGPADAPDAEAALAMQETVWEVVTSYPKTGVRP